MCLQSDQSRDPNSSCREMNNWSARHLLVLSMALLFIMLTSIVEIVQVRSNAKVSDASNANFHIYEDWTECENAMEWLDCSSHFPDYHDRGYPWVASFNWHHSSSLCRGKRKRKKTGNNMRRAYVEKDHKKKESTSFPSLSLFFFARTLLHSAHIR